MSGTSRLSGQTVEGGGWETRLGSKNTPLALQLSLRELVEEEPAEGGGGECHYWTIGGGGLSGGSLLKAGNGSCFLSQNPTSNHRPSSSGSPHPVQ